jgi:hypothetical protein
LNELLGITGQVLNDGAILFEPARQNAVSDIPDSNSLLQLWGGWNKNYIAVICNGRNVLPVLKMDELHVRLIPSARNYIFDFRVVLVPEVKRYTICATLRIDVSEIRALSGYP